MNLVPNDILSITKLFKRIISHTTHWSHKNQASQALKHGRTSEVLLLFQGHVSYVSWVRCIVLTNLVSLSEWHMLHTLHFIKETIHMKYTTCCNVSKSCFMWYKFTNGCMMLMFMKCKCKCGSKTPGVLQPSPLIKISSRDLTSVPLLIEFLITVPQIIFSFPHCIAFTTLITPHDLVKLGTRFL